MKNFDEWNEVKKSIDGFTVRSFYHKGDIWWCYLGENVGFEHNGTGINYTRPVLVVCGVSKECCVVVPLTRSKSEHKMRIKIDEGRFAVISQIRVVDVKRFKKKEGVLEHETLEKITKAIRELF